MEGQCLQVASRLPTFPSFLERHKEVFQEYTYVIKSEEFINFENPVTNCSYEFTVPVRKFTLMSILRVILHGCSAILHFLEFLSLIASADYNLPVRIMYAVYF